MNKDLDLDNDSSNINNNPNSGNVQQLDSGDSSPQHPLLSSDTPSPPTYSMYQRKPHTISATSLSVEAAHSSGQGKEATHKLQMQQLKASSQSLGLPGDSVGYRMLESLATSPKIEDNNLSWYDVLNLASSDKAILLLPNISNSFSIPVTPSFVKDHIIFVVNSRSNPSQSKHQCQIVSANCLRGNLDTEKVVFHGHINQHYSQSNILNQSERQEIINNLPPLTNHHGFETVFPNFKTLTSPATISIPGPLIKKSLRADSNSVNKSNQNQSKSTFASFFGGSDRIQLRSPLTSTSPSKNSNFKSEGNGSDHEVSTPVDINVRTINDNVNYDEVKREMIKAIINRIKERLEGLPIKVVDIVVQFVVQFYPAPPSAAALLAKKAPRKSGPIIGIPNLKDTNVSTKLIQDLYLKIRTEVQSAIYNDRYNPNNLTEELTERQKEEIEDEIEDESSLAVERVESVVTTEIFDLLFSQSDDDKVKDDELASRIAALNMLDLNLNHLGVEVQDHKHFENHDEHQAQLLVKHGLENVVNICGQTLQKICGCLSPAEKVDIIIQTHKNIVDGLSNLPKISLKHDNKDENERKDEGKDEEKFTSSADLILPLLIFSVVKSNPFQLVSNLLFIQRFRAEGMMSGEASYALVNVTAAIEFLRSVDLSELGLGDSYRIIGFNEELTQNKRMNKVDNDQSEELSSKIRTKVTAEIGDLAGSANKVLSGVVDSSWGALRGLMNQNEQQQKSTPTIIKTDDGLTSSPVNSRPSSLFNRRTSSISVASIAAGVANIASSNKDKDKEREMTNVNNNSNNNNNNNNNINNTNIPSSQSFDFQHKRNDSDGRSVRSFSSFNESLGDRMNITNRLASIPGLGRLSVNSQQQPTINENNFSVSPSQTSFLNTLFPFNNQNNNNNKQSRLTMQQHLQQFTYNPQYLNMNTEDLKFSEFKNLHDEYKKLAIFVNQIQEAVNQNSQHNQNNQKDDQ